MRKNFILLLLLAAVALGGCDSRTAQSVQQPESAEQNEQEQTENTPQTPAQDKKEEAEKEEQPEEKEEEPSEEQKEEQESEEPQEEEGKTEEEPQQTFTPKQDPAYDRYTPLVEPLCAAGILEQDFSQEQPVELDSYDWYNLLTGLDEQAAPFQGMDGNRHYAQDTVEQLLTEHFDVEIEQVRKESEGYSEEFGTYIEPQEAEDSAVPGRISGAQEKDGTLVLVVDLYSPEGKVYNTSVLTIQLQTAESEKEEEENEKENILSSLEGWNYLSNTVIFHSSRE